jgi:1-acyl-sn-glycerol-3-phosphate acyltransferase
VGRDKNEDSAEERKKLLKTIELRQIRAENGEVPPLVINPEGATTNGTHLIKFKRGAFMSLRRIKPLVSVPYSLTKVRPVSGDAVNLFDLTIISF